MHYLIDSGHTPIFRVDSHDHKSSALAACESLPIENMVRLPGVFGLAYTYTPKEGVTRERALELDSEIEIRKALPDHWIAQTLSDDIVLL
ncbi:MAG: hypothetical protein AYK19_04065 [Theionarchaea archaeon DG-70-1]|nr:MAG: hypothetical protein AYK19_04065 [Theionarchaea archaeon DG-70-1]